MRSDAYHDAVALAERQREALHAVLYVHQTCHCGMDGAPRDFACARCRAVKVLGHDPAALAVVPSGQPEGKETT